MEAIQRSEYQRLLNRNILLPIGFGLLTVIFFIGIISYLVVLAKWVETNEATANTTQLMIRLMVDQESGVRGFLLTRNEEYLESYAQAKAALPAAIAQLRGLLEPYAAQTSRLNRVVALHGRWNQYAENAIALRRQNVDPRDIVSPQGKSLMDEIRLQSEAWLAEQRDIKAAHTAEARTMVVALVGGFFALSLLLSAALAQIGRRQLIGMASSYEKLLRDLDRQNTALHDEEWLRVGEVGLAEQIIGQLPLPILCQNVLGYLAKRIDVVVGALYVRNGEEYFRREANYGFSKDNAQREQQFAQGQGLVGQAAAENRIIALKDVPPDYLKVNSGLGEIAPRHVLLMPLRAETMTVAVLELGFLRAVEQRDYVFLERVAENIGAAIVAALYRRRLHETLLEMQQLNDELQAQQEELRAANEELEEQSQVLEESQLRLESQRAELEQVNLALQENNEILRSTRGLLEQRALQLEQASRYKSEFLANMSHELRTPLNSALILSKLLADNAQNNLTEEQVRFASTIHSAGKDLLALINDVLDLSKVEAGKLDITLGAVKIADVVEALRTYFEPVAADRNLEFTYHIAADVPASINTDRQRLEQILRNLLSNAFKFTTQGSIGISVTRRGDASLAFAVRDSGIGIDADRLELIFEPFHQLDAANNRKYGGAGLGLSISRDLARLLGGTLTVDSAPRSGSTFTLALPLEFRAQDTFAMPLIPLLDRSDALTANVTMPVRDFADDRHMLSENGGALNADGRTILVVEDEINFARILFDLARELGYRCLVATTAEEAFELARRYCPSAILLDMKLPDDSGLSVLARLKEEPLTRHIPVHVVSVEERRAVALRMGAASYVLKPVTREQLHALFAVIEKNLSNEMKYVLIVEDFAKHNDNTARLISGIDVSAVTVATGEQALKLLKERVFDCMVTDYDLPDMTAAELLERMSNTDIYSFPPVIVHSSRNLSRDEEEILLRQSHSIIIKGVRSQERLIDEVALFLHRAESDLSDDKKHALRRQRSSDRAFENRTILVVDDDVRNVFALTSVLESKGAKVEVGRNGFDAIKKVNECPAIDLVLMDIMMPEMDGYEAIEKIRQDSRFATLPIIAVTAKTLQENQERCLRVGASDYVAKPVNLERLVSLIRVWLPQVQRI